MGQCFAKNKIRIVNSVSDAPLTTAIVTCHYHVMISYALADKSKSRRLGQCLMSDGFRVWFHSDAIENEFDATSLERMDDSDCVILCVSNAYSQTYRCQKEARYASDGHKRTITVQVAADYRMNDWLSFVKPGKVQFQLSDDELEFEEAYQKIVQELRRLTNSTSYFSHRSWEIPMPPNVPSTVVKERQNEPTTSTILFPKQMQQPEGPKLGYEIDPFGRAISIHK